MALKGGVKDAARSLGNERSPESHQEGKKAVNRATKAEGNSKKPKK